MQMKVLTNNQIPLQEWSYFLASNKHASPFQTVAFYQLFNSVNRLRADAVAVTYNGSIKALAVVTIQKEAGFGSYFSRRAIIYGGPLVAEDYPEALDILLKNVSGRLKGKVIYTETRNLSDFSFCGDIFVKNGYQYIPYLNIILDTGNPDRVLQNVSNSRIRQIRAAKREHVTWEVASDTGEVREFYRILYRLYTEKIGKPLLPLSFFEGFLETGPGKILLVKFENKIIGGILCPILDQKTIYEYYVCGLDAEYPKQYPSVMATWAAIEYAMENNISQFDFMGAGSPAKKYGVRDFKLRFGGSEVENGRFIRINNRFLYLTGRLALAIKSQLRK